MLWEGVSRHSAQPRAHGCPSPPPFPPSPTPLTPGRRKAVNFSQSCCQMAAPPYARALQASLSQPEAQTACSLPLPFPAQENLRAQTPGLALIVATLGLWATVSTGCASVSSSAEWGSSQGPCQPCGSSSVIDSCAWRVRSTAAGEDAFLLACGLWTSPAFSALHACELL